MHFLKNVGRAALSITLLLCVLGWLLLCTLHFSPYRIDQKTAPDGSYRLDLQSIGEPILFHSDTGRVVLRQGHKKVASMPFTLQEGAGTIHPGTWNIHWNDDSVDVSLFGAEEDTSELRLYYDGRTEVLPSRVMIPMQREPLSTLIPAPEAPPPLVAEQFSVWDGYYAIYDLFFAGWGMTFDPQVDAEGALYVVLSDTEDAVDYLVYERDSVNGACGVYVYYSCEKDPDGSWSKLNSVMHNAYAFRYKSGEVFPASKTDWDTPGNPDWQKATGEI